MYSITYRMSDIMNETSWVSSLISNDLRSKGINKAGLSFCKLITKAWFKNNSISILTEFIPLGRIDGWLLNWNMTIKKFLSWKSVFSSFDRWWTVMFIWRMSFCNDLRRSLLVSVSVWVKFMKLNVFCIWLLRISWFYFNIATLFLIALISLVLFEFSNKRLNR